MRLDDSIMRLEQELSNMQIECVNADEEKKEEIIKNAEIKKRQIRALQIAKGLH